MVQQDSTKKRVLVFIPEFPVLTETFIERELSEISSRGVLELTVLATQKGKGQVSSSLKDKVAYRRLKPSDLFKSLVFLFSRTKELCEACRALKRCGIPFTEGFYIVIKGMGYASVFSSYRPEFVLAHFMSYSSTVAMVASMILRVPYGISAHAKDVTVNPHCIREKVKNSKFVLICNRHAYEVCLSLIDISQREKVILKYHGLDLSIFNSSLQGEVHKEIGKPIVILNVGRLEEKKGQRYLLEAAKILKDKNVDFNLIIIGPGTLYSELSSYIDKENLSDRVQMLGVEEGLPFSETFKYFLSSDIFVFPGVNTSEGDADGIANVLLEAAASRLPIIATDSGSTTELITEGVTGKIVLQKDPQNLADAIVDYINNPEKASEMAQKLYLKVSQDFNISENVKVMEDYIMKGICL